MNFNPGKIRGFSFFLTREDFCAIVPLMDASTVQETIFKVAKRAYKELFLKSGHLSYKVPKQKLFPKATTVFWHPDSKSDYISAWANRFWNTVTINCFQDSIPTIDKVVLAATLAHELTHIVQFSIDSGEPETTSTYLAYVKANKMTGIFKFNPAFLGFLIPIELEALVNQGSVMHQASHETTRPMEALEEISNFYLEKACLSEMAKVFAVENAIVNIIPNHPRLLAIFSKDPEYTMAFHDLKHKSRTLAHASRLFIHLQNLVNDLDEKRLKRTIERFKKAYAKDHDPSVFERLLKKYRKKQKVCHTRA